MTAPQKRRHMGDFTVRYNGADVKIAVYVNPEEIAKRLVGRATRNSANRAKFIFGAVLVEVVP